MADRLPISILALAAYAVLAAGSLAAQEPTPAEPGSIEGTVSGAHPAEVRPLPHAWVSLPGGPASASTSTDSAGGYRLTGVPAGVRRLRIERLGYRPLELRVRVPSGRSVRLDLELRPLPVAVEGVTVRARPVRPLAEPNPSPGDGVAALELGAAGADPGLAGTRLAAAARELTGERTDEPGRVLLTRGSTAEQKLVLLDGAPVHTPFHVAGLVAGFEPRILGSAHHWVGGAPVRYDGGLSYVLDLETRPGASDAPRLEASADLLSAAVTGEAPIPRTGSVLASGRILHGAGERLTGDGRWPYGYEDALLRADLPLGDTHRLSITGFRNREEVRLGGSGPTAGPERAAVRAVADPDRASWGNEAVSMRYRTRGTRTDLEATVAGSRYRAVLPLSGENRTLARARTDRFRATAELERRSAGWTLRFGGAAEGTDHTAVAEAVVDDSVSVISGGGRAGLLAAHAEAERRLGRALRLRAGLRLDHFPRAGGPRLAPRASLAWDLTDEAVLTLAGGRFYQLPRGTELEVRVVTDDPAGVGAGHGLHPPAEATHLVLGLDQSLSETLDLGLQGFVKGFRNLPGLGDDVLRSSGVDLRMRRSGEGAEGWLGYSLAWFWNPGTGGPGEPADGSFAGRHLLATGLTATHASGLGAALRGSYGDGLPYTSVPIFGGDDAAAEPDAGPGLETVDAGGQRGEAGSRIPTLDGFLRLDLELFVERELDRGDRRTRIRPYLRVVNALSRRDALFYYFEPWRDDELRAAAERPLLPVLGVDVTF